MSGASQIRTPDTQLVRDVFNASPIGIVVENMDGQLLFVNPSSCTMLGFYWSRKIPTPLGKMSSGSVGNRLARVSGELREGERGKGERGEQRGISGSVGGALREFPLPRAAPPLRAPS